MKRSKQADSYGTAVVEQETPPVHHIAKGIYELGTVPEWRKNDGFNKEYRGLGERFVCTPQFLRDLARKLWENKRNHGLSPYLAVHVKGPSVTHKGGMIYEGAKATGWQTKGEDNKEFFCCDHKALCTDGKDHDFYLIIPVEEIVSIQVLY